jgi:type II pantothenate kinase
MHWQLVAALSTFLGFLMLKNRSVQPESVAPQKVLVPAGRKNSRHSRARSFTIVSNPNNIKLGIDIGGTLTKVVYFEPDDAAHQMHKEQINKHMRDPDSYGSTGRRHLTHEWRNASIGGTFHFVSFETSSFSNFLAFTKSSAVMDGFPFPVRTTGGGAFKYKDRMRSQLGIQLQGTDEIAALVKGIDFMVRNCPDECYYLSQYDLNKEIELAPFGGEFTYPFLVVNIGSGVSILQVYSPTVFKRVGGTALGGGTFLGLCKALTGCSTYDEAIALALKGTSKSTNLDVRTIYGGDYVTDGISLKGDTVASYFGLLGRASRTPNRPNTPRDAGDQKDELRPRNSSSNNSLRTSHSPQNNTSISNNCNSNSETIAANEPNEINTLSVSRSGSDFPPKEDLARSALLMITNNIAAVANLYARKGDDQKEHLQIVYTGSFLRNNSIALATLAHASMYWSQGKWPALFLRHDGFFGAIGCMVDPDESVPS